jgi:DNA repair protein RecN (Recombination protein N)
MLRLLSIRNFVVVDALDLELDRGFTVLTGETGAGKSILLDALALLLGDRFEQRQLRPGADRAELAAAFATDEHPEALAWLAEQGFAADGASGDDELVVRRTLDSQGRSRAWINGRPATLAQLTELGERLVDLHGQHAHQSLLVAHAQRDLLDAFGGFTALTREVGAAWRAWRDAVETSEAAARSAEASAAERATLEAQRRDLAALGMSAEEWATLQQTQSRLAHAASLIEAASASEQALTEDDGSLVRRLAAIVTRLTAGAAHDPALQEIVALLEPARIQLNEAARELRNYRAKLDLDPAELARVEERLAAIHDAARRYRVRAEALPELLRQTGERLAQIAESADADKLARRAAQARATYDALAQQLSQKREFAASELGDRVTAAMQKLAMGGGRFEIELIALSEPSSRGDEQVEFGVAAHPKQPLGPLARVASGGELSRIALAIQVVTSEVAAVPTLVFDEVDAGIGGAVAATVGRLLQSLGARRQVLCVTHLPQVAAYADANFRVVKKGGGDGVRAEVEPLSASARIDELARMLSGGAITAKTRAHAKELLETGRRHAR